VEPQPQTPPEHQSKKERTTLYVVVGIVVVILMVIGLIAYRGAKTSREADQKADQLIAAIESAGATAPDKDQIVRVLGNDGGAVCADPSSALKKAALLALMTNGATGPGIRPVVIDGRVVKGELLIIKTYCPDQLSGFQDFIDGLKTANVAGN
jgi:Tfp pilus assembly protein FimT